MFGVLYMWPRIVFAKLLKGKSIHYKLFFCICSSVVISSVFISLISMLKIMSFVLLCILFYAPLVVCIGIMLFKYFSIDENFEKLKIRNLKHKLIIIKDNILKKLKTANIHFWLKPIFCSIIVICCAVLTIHFAKYAYNNYDYGFSDIERHQAMIEDIFNNNIYNLGFYPVGFHSVILLIVFLFKTNAHSVFLFFGPIMNIVFFVAIYYWLKSIFKNKSTICVIFILFLIVAYTIILKGNSSRMIYDGLHRLNWSLPQEFVLFTVFVAPTCLIKILRSTKNGFVVKNMPNLILLSLCIASTFCVHYYTTIFQFVLCLVTFVMHIKNLNRTKFLTLVACVLAGVLLGNISTITGLVYSGGFSWSVVWAQQLPTGQTHAFEDIASVVQSKQNMVLSWNAKTAIDQFFVGCKTFFEDALVPLFPNYWWILFYGLVLISVAMMIVCVIKKQVKTKNYWTLILAAVIFLAMYAAPILNITRLLESYRLIVCLYATILPFCCVGFDISISLISKKFFKSNEK